MKNDEYNSYVVMLKNAYVTMGILEHTDVCKQIRKIYSLLEARYKEKNKMYKKYTKSVKQYLHTIKTYDSDVILQYGKVVLGILS